MSTKIIWMRHADKKFDNGKAPFGYYQHDSPLKEDINEKIYDKVELLIEKYGFPNHIICSPFLRARETKNHMLTKLKEIDELKTEDLIITYDTNISEFLGFQKPIGVPADIEHETQSYFKETVLLGERLKNLNFRVKEHIDNLISYDNIKEKCTWIITHGIVINNIYYELYKKQGDKKENKKRPESLSHLYLKINSQNESFVVDESYL
jgi:broad specificity phosphatase PhoE